MRYLLVLILLLLIIKPTWTSFDKIETLKLNTYDIEVKGHLKNPGVFSVDAYANLADLIVDLELFEDSDLDHYSINKILKHHDIIVVNKKEEFKKVSLNSASVDELMTLKGIGPKTAQLIVDYREETSGFKQLEDLMNVKGIGDATFQKLKDFIIL